MSSDITASASRPGLLSDSSQDVINQWFMYYRFSFNHPEQIAARLTQLKRLHKRRRPTLAIPGNCERFLGILAEISRLPNHRHQRDAANIIDQVNARLTRGTVAAVVPEPVRFEPLQGHASAQLDNRPLPLAGGTLPPYREPGALIPDVSARRIHRRYTDGAPVPPAENQGLAADAAIRWFPDSEDFMTAMENLRYMRADDPGLHAPLLVDNPLEVVMEFPENIPLLTAPVPQVDPRLWRGPRSPLTIYDTRAGPPTTHGALTRDHYIYNLIDLIRTKLLRPSVAAKYAIINRAHPSRYRIGSKDNIAREPPASVKEVEGVIRWILHGFPMIEIVSAGYTEGGRAAIGDAYAIEQSYREGEDYDTIVFLLFATVAHEFGHYLNTCWHTEASSDTPYFRTPRGLRYLVQVTEYEDPAHPNYHPDYRVGGEMGQVIEWLIFGFLTEIYAPPDSPDWVGRSLYIVGWGSRLGNLELLNNYVCKRLMQTRPYLRMSVRELRIFTKNLRREEESGAINRKEHGGGYEESTASTEDSGTDEETAESDAMDLEDGNEGRIALGEPPDVDAARAGVIIPNTDRGTAFRRAFIRLEDEIGGARAKRRTRLHHNRVDSCGVGTGRQGSDPDFRLHNNLNWRTNEMPVLSSGFLPFLCNFDSRIIMAGYMLLCVALDYGLRMIWPTFIPAYYSVFTATIIILGLFSMKIPDSLTVHSGNPL